MTWNLIIPRPIYVGGTPETEKSHLGFFSDEAILEVLTLSKVPLLNAHFSFFISCS